MDPVSSLASRVMQALLQKGATLSTAESCTGGLISKCMTDLPGSSAVFAGACVAYTNEIKIKLLGVDPAIIERDTEVSYACAEAMALGARKTLGTTYALSTTGFAGPGGGNDRDPVGTVYIGLATPMGVTSIRFMASIGSTREAVREQAALAALELLSATLTA